MNFIDQEEQVIHILKDKLPSQAKYHIMTYGCQMNEHDSEKISWILEQVGFHATPDPQEADLILLNTCSIRHSAEDKVYGKLGELKHQKKQRDLTIAVCGCMMQREESRNKVLEKCKHVDIIFGTNNIHKLPALLLDHYETKKRTIDIDESFQSIDDKLLANRYYPYKSFVNIMYGCNNFCSYCIVPYTRGREVSRPSQDILNEVRALVASGVLEITLLGQNVNSYAPALENGYSFTHLIYDLAKIQGLKRIRFMTSHPKDISDDLLMAFKDLDSLCNFLHLPVQAGSNSVLRKMNRRYSREDYMRKIDKVKNLVPDIALCTDIMVGFPEESEDDFQDTLDLVKYVQYDSAFTFLYSPREGTPAAEKVHQIPKEIKQDRFNRLTDTLYPIFEKKNKALVGKTLEVLVEDHSKHDKSMLTGRTEGFKLTHFRGGDRLIGKILPIKITSANSFNLEGEFIGS